MLHLEERYIRVLQVHRYTRYLLLTTGLMSMLMQVRTKAQMHPARPVDAGAGTSRATTAAHHTTTQDTSAYSRASSVVQVHTTRVPHGRTISPSCRPPPHRRAASPTRLSASPSRPNTPCPSLRTSLCPPESGPW